MSWLSKVVDKYVDPFIPEFVKKSSDALMPEWFKQSDVADALTMGMVSASSYTNTGGGGSDPNVPEVPTIENAADIAQKKVDEKRKSIARSKSVFTSPLGLGTMANTAKKLLLGE